ncbi:hypothetical protein D9M68_706320 [compost metagenome]
MLGFFLHRYGITQGASRVDQLLRRQGAAAFFTLVAISILIATDRAGTYDITIGEESLLFLVEILFTFSFFKQTIII